MTFDDTSLGSGLSLLHNFLRQSRRPTLSTRDGSPSQQFSLKILSTWHPHNWWKLTQDRGERIVFWEYEYYSSSKKWPNTNTNIIRLSKTDRIRIQILFGLPKMTEYEYKYYSGFQKRPNTNTNIIRLSKNDRIRIRILLDSLKTQIIFFCISTTMQYQRSIHSF